MCICFILYCAVQSTHPKHYVHREKRGHRLSIWCRTALSTNRGSKALSFNVTNTFLTSLSILMGMLLTTKVQHPNTPMYMKCRGKRGDILPFWKKIIQKGKNVWHFAFSFCSSLFQWNSTMVHGKIKIHNQPRHFEQAVKMINYTEVPVNLSSRTVLPHFKQCHCWL